MSTLPPTLESSPRAPSATGPVQWQYRPLAEGAPYVAVLVLIVIAVRLIVARESGSELLGLGAALALIVAGWRMLLPARYEIGPTGVKVETLWRRKRIGWRDIERIEIGRAGAFLVPPNSPWGWWRGLYLPWHGSREAVLFALQHYGQRYQIAHVSGNRTGTVTTDPPKSSSDPA